MAERRKYARLNMEATVKYRIIGQRQKNAEPAKCNNISPGGLCFTCKNASSRIKIGTRLDIEIAIKDCKPFYMIGEVIWLKDSGMKAGDSDGDFRAGVKIMEIQNEDEGRFLLQLCDRMVQKLNKEYPSTKL